MNRLLQVLNSTQLKLWHMVVGFAVTSALSLWAGDWNEQRQTINTQRINEVVEFQKVSQEFEELTREYMTRVAERPEQVDPAAREALLANIQRQFIAIRRAKPFIPSDRRVVTKEYESELIALSGELQRADGDILTTAPVWQRLNTTVQKRDAVVTELRRAANLPIEEPAAA